MNPRAERAPWVGDERLLTNWSTSGSESLLDFMERDLVTQKEIIIRVASSSGEKEVG